MGLGQPFRKYFSEYKFDQFYVPLQAAEMAEVAQAETQPATQLKLILPN